MKCDFCSEPFFAIRQDAQFCSAKCRAGAYRLRLRLAARSGGPKAVEQDPEEVRKGKHADLLTAASGSGQHPRVPLEQQVLSQLPPAAYGYRLVVGISTLLQQPVMVPDGHSWGVMPFESPSDPRLLPGHHYRIIWVDQQGQEVPPMELEQAPSLYFFLGKPNAEIAAQGTENRRQAQTILELRRQVQKLEDELVAARESCRISEEKRKEYRRKMRRRVRQLKAAHRKDSLSVFARKLGPIVAAGAGGYALHWYRGSSSQPAAQRTEAEEPDQDAKRRAELDAVKHGLLTIGMHVAEDYAKTNPAVNALFQSMIAAVASQQREQNAGATPGNLKSSGLATEPALSPAKRNPVPADRKCAKTREPKPQSALANEAAAETQGRNINEPENSAHQSAAETDSDGTKTDQRTDIKEPDGKEAA